jgi:fructose-1,6-bisphosphatase/inositol monophosphatase family enzyme
MSQGNGSAAIDVATVAEGIYTVCIKNGSLRYTDKINIRR